MRGRVLALLLLVAVAGAGGGCGWFESSKTPLPGERISVLSLNRELEPDPELAKTPISLPAPVANPDWPQPGGYPNHAMQHLALPDRISEAWKAELGEGSSRYTRVLAQPIVAGGRVFAMDGGVTLSALDAATGKRLWRVDLKPDEERGNSFGGGPALWNDRLYVSTGYAEVLALDPADGKVIWRKSVGAPVAAAPTVLDGRVFVVTVDNELVALAADDGRRLWTHNGMPETAGLLGERQPGGRRRGRGGAPIRRASCIALTVENGRPLWSDNLAATRAVNAVSGARRHPRAAGHRSRPGLCGRATAAAWPQSTCAPATGCGSRKSAAPTALGSPGIILFVLSNDNELLCLTRNEGKVRWVRQLPSWRNPKKKEGPIAWAGPVLGGDRLIVLSSDGEAVSVSPYTGEPLGRIEISRRRLSRADHRRQHAVCADRRRHARRLPLTSGRVRAT